MPRKTARGIAQRDSAGAPVAPAARENEVDKKLLKKMKKKSYAACKACGKRYRMSAPAVWDKGWREIIALDGRLETHAPRFLCARCGRLAPVAGYLCKPVALEKKGKGARKAAKETEKQAGGKAERKAAKKAAKKAEKKAAKVAGKQAVEQAAGKAVRKTAKKAVKQAGEQAAKQAGERAAAKAERKAEKKTGN